MPLTTFKNPKKLIGICSNAPGSGKSAIADCLKAKGFVVVPFARPLKDMVCVMLQGMGYSEMEAYRLTYERKEELIEGLGVSARHLLQTLGTEWGRTCVSPYVWLTHWKARVSNETYVVVDDVRFRNEAEAVLSMGGEMWMVERPGVVSTTTHASEGGLSDWPYFSHYIRNAGSLKQLQDAIAALPLGKDGSDPTELRVVASSEDTSRAS